MLVMLFILLAVFAAECALFGGVLIREIKETIWSKRQLNKFKTKEDVKNFFN